MRKALCIILYSICAVSAVYADVEIRCKQEITVVGKTTGEHSILFYHENWKKGQHCGNQTIFILFLSSGGAYVLERKFAGPIWATNYLDELGRDSSILIEKSDGRYHLNDSIYFKSAPVDSTFPGSFWKLPRNDAVTWNWEYGRYDGYDLPVINGAEWNLVYKHNEGIYKNYMIREVYFYPKSSYVVIKTLQPQLDETNKTMDGLMIFYIK